MDEVEDIYQFGFSSGWLTNAKYETMLAAPLTPELVPIAEAFKTNMMRSRNLGALVPEIAYWMRLYARFGDYARYRLGRPIEMPGRVRGAPKLDQELINEITKVHAEWLAARPSDNEVASGQAWEDGGDLIKPFVNSFPDFHGNGIETLMSATLLELWAASEAMLQDLWVTALNMHPDPLASNVLGNDKSISIDMLKRFSYDVSGKMGTIMLISQKVDMNSSNGIRSAYKTAFSDQNPDEIFERYHPHIYHLEAVRNLFAHRSGLIDEKFIKRTKNSTILPSPLAGERLKLNGKIVSTYADCCVSCAADIFVFVDRWIYGQSN
ncbi:MAG: hypothetical protein JWO15_1692 [Sphingomonadales bacterium]|nr:hypothetical protein [Sphingomonadales bacterium]